MSNKSIKTFAESELNTSVEFDDSIFLIERDNIDFIKSDCEKYVGKNFIVKESFITGNITGFFTSERGLFSENECFTYRVLDEPFIEMFNYYFDPDDIITPMGFSAHILEEYSATRERYLGKEWTIVHTLKNLSQSEKLLNEYRLHIKGLRKSHYLYSRNIIIVMNFIYKGEFCSMWFPEFYCSEKEVLDKNYQPRSLSYKEMFNMALEEMK